MCVIVQLCLCALLNKKILKRFVRIKVLSFELVLSTAEDTKISHKKILARNFLKLLTVFDCDQHFVKIK